MLQKPSKPPCYLWQLDFAWVDKIRAKTPRRREVTHLTLEGFHSSFKRASKRRHKTHPLPGGLNLCLIVIEWIIPSSIQALPTRWFNWKICSSKWIISPDRGEHKKCLKPFVPPFVWQYHACERAWHFDHGALALPSMGDGKIYHSCISRSSELMANYLQNRIIQFT